MKTISVEELTSLQNSGADVTLDRKALDIPDVAEQLKRLADKPSDSDAILAALATLTVAIERISITVNPTDLKPILDAVRLIKSQVQAPVVAPPKPCAYRFEVERDNRQLMQSVVAIPIGD